MHTIWYADIDCYPDDEHVPVLSGSENHTTVEGEMVLFKCSFGDNYSPIDYDVYWELTLEDGNHITVMDYINYTDFQMKTYQDCPPSNYSCCRFTSQLSIHTNLSMNNAIVTCSAIINELTSYSSSALSELMYYVNNNLKTYFFKPAAHTPGFLKLLLSGKSVCVFVCLFVCVCVCIPAPRLLKTFHMK